MRDFGNAKTLGWSLLLVILTAFVVRGLIETLNKRDPEPVPAATVQLERIYRTARREGWESKLDEATTQPSTMPADAQAVSPPPATKSKP